MTKDTQSPCNGIFRDPVHLVAFGFGSGCSRWAPGTFGTIVAIPFFLLLVNTPLWFYLCVTLAMFLAGIWICGRVTKKLGVHDHSGIVWDEIVGYLITMIAVPDSWLLILTGFVLFRLFDILKPWPVSLADRRLKGGFGIMFDDVIAGGLAWMSIQLIIHYKIF